MTELPLYGTVKCCPACGYDGGPHLRHITEKEATRRANCGSQDAYMERTCPLCKYIWRERPLYEDECKCDPMSRSRLSGRLGSTKLSDDECRCGCDDDKDCTPSGTYRAFIENDLERIRYNLRLYEQALHDGR